MGEITKPRPVLLIAAIISRHQSCFDWALEKLKAQYGETVFESELFDFSETSFYKKEMGEGLLKQLVAFESLIDPSEIALIKVQTNELEAEYKNSFQHDEQRPLNIDPGYLTEAKVVLATTKNRDHRIYLQRGIFGEITLFFQGGKWQSSRWTYPDYRRPDYHQFFDRCRDWLRDRFQEMKAQGQL